MTKAARHPGEDHGGLEQLLEGTKNNEGQTERTTALLTKYHPEDSEIWEPVALPCWSAGRGEDNISILPSRVMAKLSILMARTFVKALYSARHSASDLGC